MNRELHELNLEIQKVRRELGDILEHENDVIGNELTIKVSKKLDKLIVKYIQISMYSK